jgi:hypothetical protein
LLREENSTLKSSFKQLKSQYSVLKSSYYLLEKEKIRHLEQNALDKEVFNQKIEEKDKKIHAMKEEILKLREMIEIVYLLNIIHLDE